MTTKARHVALVVENVPLARDHRLRKQAGALRDEGYDVTVICPRDPGNHCLEGVVVWDYPAPREGSSKVGFLWEYAYSWLRAAVLVTKLFFVHRFDALQISGTPDIYFTLGAPFKRLGIPLVLDQRDLSPEVYASRYGKGRLHDVLLWWERHSFRSADVVVTVNESLRRVVVERGGVDPDQVVVVGNGPRVSRITPLLDRSERHGDLCVWVGLMGPQDEVPLLLQAVVRLVELRGPEGLSVVLIGDGEERPAIARLVDRLGLSDVVRLTGWLPEQEVFSWLARADVGLEPNLEPVVSPVKVMEYMAFGLPFVSFDLPETRVLGGAAGTYVDAGDTDAFASAVHELLEDPEERARRGKAGRRAVQERVAWEHQAPAYLSVFRRLLPPRRSEKTGLRSVS